MAHLQELCFVCMRAHLAARCSGGELTRGRAAPAVRREPQPLALGQHPERRLAAHEAASCRVKCCAQPVGAHSDDWHAEVQLHNIYEFEAAQAHNYLQPDAKV